MAYWQALQDTLSITAPVFLIVFLGLILKRRKIIDEGFVTIASNLVFRICLPLLIFLAMIDNPVDVSGQWSFVLFCAIASVGLFMFFWWGAAFFVQGPDRGVVVQGAFRSNLGVMGIALCAKAFGGEGLAVGAVILAVVVPLFNILSIYALSHSLSGGGQLPWRNTLAEMVRNPLIIAIFIGFMCSQFGLVLPKVLYDASSYLANMTLPLALIAIGGAISLNQLKDSSGLSSQAVIAKLLLAPILVMIPALFMGFSPVQFGCILLMFASPSAAAGFVMVRAMGGNDSLASNIIVLSTLFSALSISLLLYVSKVLSWI